MKTLDQNLALARAAIAEVGRTVTRGASNRRVDRMQAEGGIENLITNTRHLAQLPPMGMPSNKAVAPDASDVIEKVAFFKHELNTPPPVLGLSPVRFGFPGQKLIKEVKDMRKQYAWPYPPTLPRYDEIEDVAFWAIGLQCGNCFEQSCVAVQQLLTAADLPDAVDLMQFTSQKYDHVWVVVGRINNSNVQDPRTWGKNAVWCDPWQVQGGIAYGVQDFVAGKIVNLNAAYKCNTVELVEAGKPLQLFRWGNCVETIAKLDASKLAPFNK